MELWDLYDKNGNLTGKTCSRSSTILNEFYHLIVHVWIKNKKGEYLISQRSKKKETFPLMWDCVVGAVIKGETSIEGALREVKEEIGLDFTSENGRLIKTFIRESDDGIKSNEIINVWLFEFDGIVNLKNATTDEVEKVKWMNKEKINKLLITKKMVPTLNYFMTDQNFS